MWPFCGSGAAVFVASPSAMKVATIFFTFLSSFTAYSLSWRTRSTGRSSSVLKKPLTQLTVNAHSHSDELEQPRHTPIRHNLGAAAESLCTQAGNQKVHTRRMMPLLFRMGAARRCNWITASSFSFMGMRARVLRRSCLDTKAVFKAFVSMQYPLTVIFGAILKREDGTPSGKPKSDS